MKKNLDRDDYLNKYNNIKNKLDTIYGHITKGIRIRSKYNWYEHSKKSAFFFFFFFFDFRKIARRSKCNKKIIVDGKKTSDQTHILECLKEFYEILFKKSEQKTVTEVKRFLSHIKISKLSEDIAKPFWRRFNWKTSTGFSKKHSKW